MDLLEAIAGWNAVCTLLACWLEVAFTRAKLRREEDLMDALARELASRNRWRGRVS